MSRRKNRHKMAEQTATLQPKVEVPEGQGASPGIGEGRFGDNDKAAEMYPAGGDSSKPDPDAVALDYVISPFHARAEMGLMILPGGKYLVARSRSEKVKLADVFADVKAQFKSGGGSNLSCVFPPEVSIDIY